MIAINNYVDTLKDFCEFYPFDLSIEGKEGGGAIKKLKENAPKKIVDVYKKYIDFAKRSGGFLPDDYKEYE